MRGKTAAFPKVLERMPSFLSPFFSLHNNNELQTTACSLFETCVDCLERLPVSSLKT